MSDYVEPFNMSSNIIYFCVCSWRSQASKRDRRAITASTRWKLFLSTKDKLRSSAVNSTLEMEGDIIGGVLDLCFSDREFHSRDIHCSAGIENSPWEACVFFLICLTNPSEIHNKELTSEIFAPKPEYVTITIDYVNAITITKKIRNRISWTCDDIRNVN